MAAASAHAQAAAFGSLLVAREYLYTLFHKLFGGDPTRELYAELVGDATLDALDEYADESPELARARTFVEGLREVDQERLLDEGKDEFTRLFIGPAQLVAYPWEAPYVGNSPSVCQESTLSVRLAYEEHGWQPRKLLRVPDDHVSLMCTFLARLASQAADALEAKDTDALAGSLRDQEGFVHRHLANWVDEYAQHARRSKTAVLYPQLIEVFADFVHMDEAFLTQGAFWVEGLEVLPALDEQDAVALGAMRSQTALLCGLRLFGLEDNELVDAA